MDDFSCVFSNWATFCNLLLKSSSKNQNMVVCSKNHRFGQNFATFRTKYHMFAFRWTFKEKVAKSVSFREKARKIIHLANLCNFSSKLPCLGIFMIFSARSCKKCLIPWKSPRNHRFGQNYATFSKKLPCLCISINFSKKCCKKCLISWKSTKNHWFCQSFATFGKSHNVFFLWMNFREKSCKKCVVSWKSRKNRPFGQDLQLLEETTMFWHFDDYCRKKLQKGGKVAHFVKNDEKSSIWPKLAISRGNYHVSAFLSTFQQKVSHFVKKHEKSSFGSCLAHS